MKKRFLGIAVALAAVAAVAASPAAAATVDCGRAGGMVTGTVSGSVVVGPGVSCLVAGAHVTGSLTVQPGGSLLMIGSRVDRNLASAGAAWLVVAGSNTIGGGVQITGTTGLPPSMSGNVVCTTTVGGALMLAGNTAPFQIGCGPGLGNVFRSVLIGGNAGAVAFQYNSVAGTAICTGPSPFTGTGNTAAKKIGCP